MTETELRALVADFCATKWIGLNSDRRESDEVLSVSREADRAIRNMSGLTVVAKRLMRR